MRRALKSHFHRSFICSSLARKVHRTNFVARGHMLMTSCRDKGPFSLPRGGIDTCETEA
jgi:hypothetical protein